MKGGFFLVNGQFHKESEAVFNLRDLSLRAEGFSESFRAEHNEILFAESICSHLVATAATLGLDLTGLIDPEGRLLRKDVSRLLNKNKLYSAAKICIQIFPSDTHVNVLLNAEEIERGYYPVKESGLLISFRQGRGKAIHPDVLYSPVEYSAKPADTGESNSIILNREGFACECVGGSFAYIGEGKVFFTSDSPGGYRCAIKEEIFRSAEDAGFQVIENENITASDLLQAEELFLYDSCIGIRKVLGLEDRRYFSTKTHSIAKQLTLRAMQDRKRRE